ncbi:MAG TPA: TaqI family restriction endonuclease [Candidatus Limnocylindrales bacterium]|nr:TaqI family restriction endonuclease [Candidatus Limnocylindrales bacterium]
MHKDAFEEFLGTLNLKAYRDTYRPIKLVEMDLPKDMQALEALYITYWDQRRFIGYEAFYQEYRDKYRTAIEAFRNKITMCEDCYYRGLPARIYRTWASIITQIHAGYVAESVFGQETVNMSVELDHKGADFQVIYKGQVLNYQVKKKTFSREVRTAKVSKNPIAGRFIDIGYEVPTEDYFVNPLRQNGEYKLPYLRFINNKELKRLPNGFVVFTPYTFETVKTEIDKDLQRVV